MKYKLNGKDINMACEMVDTYLVKKKTESKRLLLI